MDILLFKLILREADIAIASQNSDGSFAGGHNGPYFDKETPARNTAHWLFLLCQIYRRTNVLKYYESANKATDYLLSGKDRPANKTFICRTNPLKDCTNGVIGQAWIMEALIEASEVLGRPECYELAEDLFLLHPWSEKYKIWHRVDPDGLVDKPDYTFNHQLWFGAIAGSLKNTKKAQKRSLDFFNYHATKVRLYKNGVVYHRSSMRPGSINLKDLDDTIRYLKVKVHWWLRRKIWHKSAGYHGFNLYAYGLYKQHLPDHEFWNSDKFKKMLSVITTRKFIKEQYINKYSYPYNPTGLELAFVLEVFGNEYVDKAEWWLNQQIEQTYNFRESIMTKNSKDPNTSKARLYEACRLQNDYSIKLPGQIKG